MNGEISKVLILTCSTGEGHNSAARAIAEYLSDRGVVCEIADSVAFKSERACSRVAKSYNNLIRRAPAVFGMIYRLGRWYDNRNWTSPVYSYNAKYADKLYAYIAENDFDCVICTHLFGMQTMTAVRKQFAPDLPCFGVLTDYTAIPFYKDTELTAYFAPNETAVRELVDKGIAQNKIIRSGIPVSAKFCQSMTQEEARAHLSVPQNKKMIAVMSGGGGCGKIVKLCRALVRSFDEEHVAYVFCGKNKKLKARLDRKFGTDGKIRSVAFTTEVNYYLKAADVVLSKPGGLSSTEIAVSNVPFVHLKAIPGCETQNIRYFTANGLSVSAKNVPQAIRAVRRLLSDEALTDSMRENQRRVIDPNASGHLFNRIFGARA